MTWAKLVLKRAAELGPEHGALTAEALRTVCAMEFHGHWTPTQAKKVLAYTAANGLDPLLIGTAWGYGVDPPEATTEAADKAVADYPEEWERYKAGEARLAGFFVGKVMAATNNQADGRAAIARLRELAG